MFTFIKETRLDDLGAGVSRRILAHSGKMMAVEVSFATGAIGPMHNHPHEQTTCQDTVQGTTRTTTTTQGEEKETSVTKTDAMGRETENTSKDRKGNILSSTKTSYRDWETDRKSTRLNSSHITRSRMPSSA